MKNLHSFHIPVMGTGFTIDTPFKVARYGISSAVSLADDQLIETVREYYCKTYEKKYVPITNQVEDFRAKRITEYLNLIDEVTQEQFEALKNSSFEEDSEINKYFDLLDEEQPLKKIYKEMNLLAEGEEKRNIQMTLRTRMVRGNIDVNILTKQQRDIYKNGEQLPLEYADTFLAVKGFAKSSLESSVVFSAGLNPRLYSYVENFDDFYPDANGKIKKKIILKVSDSRSAIIQGKIFAKKGLWVSEFRIESGLNCGGHTFPTQGLLLGPILEEFKQNKNDIKKSLWELCQKGLQKQSRNSFLISPELRITVQGGIGANQEDKTLRKYYELDGTGWGSPFLLVPEVTSIDEDTLKKLVDADDQDIRLTQASPFGVPYYSLMNSKSNEVRLRKIEEEKPGSPCITKALTFDKEFSEEGLCVSSSQYQQKKIEQLRNLNLNKEEFDREYEQVVEKECICHNLGGSILKKYDIEQARAPRPAAICPGPNLVFFSKTYSLKEMVDHIYGKINLIQLKTQRPHVLINELKLYVEYLKNKVAKALPSEMKKESSYFLEFKQNLMSGINYYQKIAKQFFKESETAKNQFVEQLLIIQKEIQDFVASHKVAFEG